MTQNVLRMQGMRELLSRTPPLAKTGITIRVLETKREVGRILQCFVDAGDALPEVGYTFVPDPLIRGEFVQHSRYVGPINWWKSRRWHRYEILLTGTASVLGEYFRIVESLYERS
jgi:hypothetical protein